MKRLIVVGGGAKAMALAAKATVLEELEFAVPELLIIEKRDVGANWLGDAGHTDGRPRLGTSPDKDLGFPYCSAWHDSVDPEIDRRMQRFSWQSFLIAQHGLSDWVDRGRRPPTHRQWALYLSWAARQLSKRVSIVRGEVTRLSMKRDAWCVAFAGPTGLQEIWADGVVLTGPGDPTPVTGMPHERVVTAEAFWRDVERFEAKRTARVAIVGTGEAAATIAVTLVERCADSLAIEVIAARGVTYSRGESFHENRVYSNPGETWLLLSREQRLDFIARTDRAVFSLAAQRVLDAAENVRIVPKRLLSIGAGEDDTVTARVGWSRASDPDEAEVRVYDYVILATGHDPFALLRRLVAPETQRLIVERAALAAFSREAVEDSIDHHLAIDRLFPRLHVPGLAGPSQGPGFPNLSCLGRLADRVLEAHVRAPDGSAKAPPRRLAQTSRTTLPERRTPTLAAHGRKLHSPGLRFS